MTDLTLGTSRGGSIVTASFTASRHELFDDTILLGTAEIARQVCRRADRVLSVLAVTPERLRRIDGWSDADGLVTHAAGVDERDRVAGSVCRTQDTSSLFEAVIRALVGPLPPSAAPRPILEAAVAGWSPSSLPASWAVVVTVSNRPHLVIAERDGLVGASVEHLATPTDLDPIDPALLADLLDRLTAGPRTVAQILAD